ncbi:hypothetical protein RFI_00113, partial [Reticulomyxa filosa]
MYVKKKKKVEIDLNGKEIEMSVEFRVQQRFYANIEIGSAPFIQGQGPAHFELHIYEFEVGGIQMNHFSNVIIRNVEIGPSAVNVPVTAYWSNARFGLLNFRYLRDSHGDQLVHFANRQETKSVEDIVDDLELTMDAVCEKLFSGNIAIADKDNPIRNDDDQIDTYHQLSQKATIENVTIHDLNIKTHEFGAFKSSDKLVNTGPYGDVFNMFAVFDVGRESLNSEYSSHFPWRNLTYRGHVLSDAQIALSMFGDADSEKGKAGTSVSSDLIQWVTQGTSLPTSSKLICNGDVMFHATKGVVGLRIDNVDGVFVDNVSIKYLNNWSEMGHYTCNDESDQSHIIYSSQTTIPTNHYEGAATRAISVINSKHVLFGDIHVHNIVSSYGNAFGLHVFDNLTDFQFFDNFVVDGVAAASSFTHSDVLS